MEFCGYLRISMWLCWYRWLLELGGYSGGGILARKLRQVETELSKVKGE